MTWNRPIYINNVMFCVDPPHLGDRKKTDMEFVLETIPSFTNCPAKHKLINWRWYSGGEECSAQA